MNRPADALDGFPYLPWRNYAHRRYKRKRLPENPYEVIQFLTGRNGEAVAGFDVMSRAYRETLRMLGVYGVDPALIERVTERIHASEWLHYAFGENRRAELIRSEHVERILKFIQETEQGGDPRERMTRPTIQLPAETQQQLRTRIERTAQIAKLLVSACLDNHDVRRLIADPDELQTEEALIGDPIVRIDYEEAFAISSIGEGLAMTEGKHWGRGPQILPLEPDDPVNGRHILYTFKPNSRYNRRFEQRQRMKEMLGSEYRRLVERAKYGRHSLKVFLANLREDEALAIRRVFEVEPNVFRRAARGKLFLDLPVADEQTYFDFMADRRAICQSKFVGTPCAGYN